MADVNPSEYGAAIGYIIMTLGGVATIVWSFFKDKLKKGEKPEIPVERRPHPNEVRQKLDEFHNRFDSIASQLRNLQGSLDEGIPQIRKRLSQIEIEANTILEKIEEIKERDY